VQSPTNTLVAIGSNVTLAGSAFGIPAPTLQWLKNGSMLAGQTNSVLLLTKCSNLASGQLQFARLEFAAVTVSTNAALVVDSPPVITKQPTNQTVYVGDPVAFFCMASGTAPLSFQWQLNGNPLPAATSIRFGSPARERTMPGTIASW